MSAAAVLRQRSKERACRLTELGNAERLAIAHGDRLRYVKAWGKWLAWDGRRWKRDELGAEMAAAKDVVRDLYAEAAKAAETAAKSTNGDGSLTDESTKAGGRAEVLMKWARTTSKATSISAMLKLAQSEEPIAATADMFDRDLWSFNVLNGTLDLRTGELRPHRQSDMITMLAPVEYLPDTTCPRWETFLEKVLPDAEVRTWMQGFLGYALTGSVREHALAFTHGSGANGKSTALEVMLELLGDYARSAAPDLLLAKHGEAHPTEVADLEGARLVVVQEIDEGRKWAVAMIKRLTGGDRIKARHMRQDFYEFQPTHKLVIASNTKPELTEQSHAIWRRLRLVPFDVTIPKLDRDPDLKSKLLEERSGILAWLVRGCLAWQRDGLGEAEAITKATVDYQAEQDVLGKWIDERCVLLEGAWTSSIAIYEDFAAWCKASGRMPWKLDTMKARLVEREGLSDRRKTGARGVGGIALRSDRPHSGTMTP